MTTQHPAPPVPSPEHPSPVPPPVAVPLPPGLAGAAAPAAPKGQAVDGLRRLSAFLWSAAELLSGGLPAVPEFEAKLGMGLHLFQITDALAACETRLTELGAPPRGRRPRAAGTALAADTPAERILWPAYGELLDRAVRQAADVLAAPGELADGPTRRLLRLHLPELRAARDWGTDAALRYRAALPAEAAGAFDRWRAGLRVTPPDPAPSGRSAPAGRSAPPDPAPGPSAPAGGSAPAAVAGSAARMTGARRDGRFTLFSDTRDYRAGEPEPATEEERYAADLLELARTNRDEIDALETFALVYFDLLDEAPTAMLHDLARTAWDEARHALLGHHLLEHTGHDPYRTPCSMIGIEVRSRLGGWDALAQISLFGELNIIGPMRSLAHRAHDRGDRFTSDAFDHICADESLHLHRVRGWLRSHHPLRDLDRIEAHTKRVAGRELERAGVLGEEFFVRLTSREIFELLGE